MYEYFTFLSSLFLRCFFFVYTSKATRNSNKFVLTGRRLDHSRTISSVDIGVTDVTKTSRLFAVPSTTSPTLLLAATH